MLAEITLELWIAIAGVVVAALALFAALREGRKQVEKMEAVRDDLKRSVGEARGEIETHFIGTFPGFIPQIVRLLEGAEKSITIFCDFPAYGLVSNPESHAEYMRTIKGKAEKDVEVKMLHLDYDGRMANLASQYGDSWEDLAGDPMVAAFASGADLNPEPLASFLKTVEEGQADALRPLKAARVTAYETDLIMPIYFWIADEKAIFALPQFTRDGALEVGFQTASGDLIAAMKGTYKRYFDSRTDEKRGGVSPAAHV